MGRVCLEQAILLHSASVRRPAPVGYAKQMANTALPRERGYGFAAFFSELLGPLLSCCQMKA